MFVFNVESDNPMDGYKVQCLKHKEQPLLLIEFCSKTPLCKESYRSAAKYDVGALCLRCVVEQFSLWSPGIKPALENQGVQMFCQKHFFVRSNGVKESPLFRLAKYVEWAVCEDHWFCDRCIGESMRRAGLIQPVMTMPSCCLCPQRCGDAYDTREEKIVSASRDDGTSRYRSGACHPIILHTSCYCPTCFVAGLKKSVSGLKMMYHPKSG